MTYHYNARRRPSEVCDACYINRCSRDGESIPEGIECICSEDIECYDMFCVYTINKTADMPRAGMRITA